MLIPRLEQRPPIGFSPEGSGKAAHENPESPCIGVRAWENNINHFAVAEIHYTADPTKRSDEWRSEAASHMPGGIDGHDWARYMELDWSIHKGLKVFPEFINKDDLHPSVSHIIQPRIPIPDYWSRRMGIDPASVNPFAVTFAAISPEGIIVWYDELYIRNAYDLRIETDEDHRYLTGTAAVKYTIHQKMGNQVFDDIFIDPASKQRQLISFGAEAPRTNLLEQLQAEPDAISCRPPRRRGRETIEIEHFRKTVFMRRHFPSLSADTLMVLGLDPKPEGYMLFGGYFCSNMAAQRHEIANLKWQENPDPNSNAPETIQDYDNHTWDANKYMLSEDWTPARLGDRVLNPLTDWRKVRQQEIMQALNEASQQLAALQRGDAEKKSDWIGEAA